MYVEAFGFYLISFKHMNLDAEMGLGFKRMNIKL